MSLSPDTVERYESLRKGALRDGRAGDQGWALLIRGGFLAWAEAGEERIANERVAPLSSPIAAFPDHLSVPVVQVLAGMVLFVQQELAHGV